jgi:hypothetical protein
MAIVFNTQIMFNVGDVFPFESLSCIVTVKASGTASWTHLRNDLL